MPENSAIEWTDHTGSPWYGCAHGELEDGTEHPGCAHCYAEAMSKRNPLTLGEWGKQGRRVRSKSFIANLRKWNRDAAAAGKIVSVFPSLCDPFEDWSGLIVDNSGHFLFCCRGCGKIFAKGAEPACECHCREHDLCRMNDLRREMFATIDECSNVRLLLLTKRPGNVRQMMPAYSYHACITGDCPHERQAECDEDQAKGYRDNIAIGTSISDQATADELVPKLLACHDLSPVLFLSVEPLIGPVNLARSFLHCECPRCGGLIIKAVPTSATWCADCCVAEINRFAAAGDALAHDGMFPTKPLIDWVIVGGESGQHPRPMHPQWARDLRHQCVDGGVPFFFKQWGEHLPFDQVRTAQQREAWSKAVVRGDQSYFGARIVAGPEGPMTGTTQGVEPVGYAKVGKAVAGRLLDDREWNEMPSAFTAEAAR